MKIGYLGPKGTFTHYACQRVYEHESWPSDHTELIDFQSLDHLFDALNNDDIDAVFSPFENSIEGPVNRVLDSLISYPNTHIHCLYEMPINQSIFSFNGTLELINIEHIISMPHAIAQCFSFIKKYCPNAMIHHASSTARSVTMIDSLNLPKETTIVIGHESISNYFPISLIEKNIQDQKQNKTQFCLIRKASIDFFSKDSPYLGLIAFSTPKDQPGSLSSVLDIFKDMKINLTKILSRPEKSDMGTYVFFIEFLMEFSTLSTIDLLSKVQERSQYFKHIGFYRSVLLDD